MGYGASKVGRGARSAGHPRYDLDDAADADDDDAAAYNAADAAATNAGDAAFSEPPAVDARIVVMARMATRGRGPASRIGK